MASNHQSTGAPVERSGRSLSISEPQKDTPTETLQDSESGRQQAAEDDTIQSPRLCQPARSHPARRVTRPSLQTADSTSSTSSESSRTSRKSYQHRSSRSHRSHHSSSTLEPPVTKHTLRELDVGQIIQNPKLRHDINYDPELHFRPNMDGLKGKAKQDKANVFWRALSAQLQEFIADPPTFGAKHANDDTWCLPTLFRAVKEIIQTLVPQRDKQLLDEGLNVSLLMQQFLKGVMDLEKLAQWLSQVLKSHCAPMRDAWVDSMYEQLSRGNSTGDLNELVGGMRTLMNVLEAMKLDVANHQIRCLRPYLIEDTVQFEAKWFQKKYEMGRLHIGDAEPWYQDALQRFQSNTDFARKFGETNIFFQALARMILPSQADKRMPGTFIWDEERILKLRIDAADAVNLDICMRLYDDLIAKNKASTMLTPSHDEKDSDDDSSNSIQSGWELFSASNTTSRPTSMVFSSSGSTASSPRSSILFVDPQIEQYEAKAKRMDLQHALLALVQTAPTSSNVAERWRNLAPTLALEIFRSFSTSDDSVITSSSMLPRVEATLMESVCKTDSSLYMRAEQRFMDLFSKRLSDRVCEFKDLTAVGLYSQATRGPTHSRVADPHRERDCDSGSLGNFDEASLDDMASRLAHLGVLHWRVWAPLVYVDNLLGIESMNDTPMSD